MIVAGIDVGGKKVHIVIKKDGQILGKGTSPTGIKKAEAVEALYDQVLKQAGLTGKEGGGGELFLLFDNAGESGICRTDCSYVIGILRNGERHLDIVL